MLTVTDPLGGVTTTDYDPDRNVISVEDPNGNTTAYDHDAVGRVVQVTRPDSTTLEYGYDANGAPISYTDGAGNTTDYEHGDPALPSAVTAATDPLDRTTTSTYDRAGRVVTTEQPGGDCEGGPATGCITYDYDAAGQITAVDFTEAGTPDITSVDYDDLGRRVAIQDSAAGELTWTYDSLGRLTSSGDGTTTTGYGYDLAGSLTTLSYPGSGHTVTRGYDDASRMETSTDWDSNTTTFGYDADGEVDSVVYPSGGLVDTSTYDAAGRMDTVTMAATGGTLADIDADRDDAGQLKGEDHTSLPGPDRTWGYDDLERLTDQDTTPTWGYDDADNLTQTTSGDAQVFDDADQLCSTAATAGTCASPAGGATVYGYDTRGNRVEADPASGPTVTYNYDQANRLVSHDDTSTAWAYTYRPDGLRATSDDGTDTTGFTWDQATGLPGLLAETTGGDTTSYLYGPGGLAYAQIDEAGDITYLHHDQLGSTRLLTDDAGAVTGTATYDPYGTPTTTGTQSRLGYAGQYTDPTGLQYLRARYYDTGTGQFVSRDPISSLTRDSYGYASRSPLNRTDPMGLCDINPFGNDTCLSDGANVLAGATTNVFQGTPGGMALDAVSSATDSSVGICVGGDVFGGYDLMGSLCYMATPSGHDGFTVSAGGGGGAPFGASGLVGLSVSNAQDLSDFGGNGHFVDGGAGDELLGAGGSWSGGKNSCGQTINQYTFGWNPSLRVPAPLSFGGGAQHTWTFG